MVDRREFIATAIKGIAGLTLIGVFSPLSLLAATGCDIPNCPDTCSSCDTGACDATCDTAAGCDSAVACDVATGCDNSSACDIPSGCDLAAPDGCSKTVTDTHCSPTSVRDSNCGNGNKDAHCGGYDNGSFDKDDNCNKEAATYDKDNSCYSGGNHANTDNSCELNSTDANCYIRQAVNSNDHDETCSTTHPDNSCGDCDDNHDTDEHCAVNGDPDGLCGHQHGDVPFYNGGVSTDQNCSATSVDGGCGTHTTSYGNTDTDIDESCTATIPSSDANCSNLTSDSTCGSTRANPSTTSPDEKCGNVVNGVKDDDGACGHYDADESCGNGNVDSACGKTNIEGLPDPVDPDGNCGINGDPDNSNDYNYK